MVALSYCCVPRAGGAATARVSVSLSGSGLAGRTTESTTVLPGLPSSISRMTASDSSRVDWLPMDSITSPSDRCVSAGEPGMTFTTVAYP